MTFSNCGKPWRFGITLMCGFMLTVAASLNARAMEVTNTLAPGVSLTDVFVSGEGNFDTFRIPAIASTRTGALLAFAEARASKNDHSQNKLALKVSTNRGYSWSSLKILVDEGKNCINNPAVVVDRTTGRVIVMFQVFPEAYDSMAVAPGLVGDKICRSFDIYSDDNGATWSKPREITASVKRPTRVTSVACGPGVGIQLIFGEHMGRLVMPFNQGPHQDWEVYAVLSDDHGAHWRYGELAPKDSSMGPNEVQMVELPDGKIMLNARDQGAAHRRLAGISDDGGETWSRLNWDQTLIDPRCQGSIIPQSIGVDERGLLFSNPASTEGRTNGTIRLSSDWGKTWETSRTLYAGSFAYSCLVSLDRQNGGCLFERDGYKAISFATFTVNWISGKDGAR